MIKFNSKYATKPGEIILDYLDYYGFSQKWLSERIGCTEKHVCEILSGRASISADLAVKLSSVVGSTADFWLSLENNYKIYNARIVQEKQANEELQSDIFVNMPYNDLVKLGWVPATKKPVEKVLNLYDFFNVSSLGLILKTQNIAFRKTDDGRVNDYAVAAWLQEGENRVKKLKFDNEYNEQELRSALYKILDVVYEMPDDFFKRTVDILADCGVILIAVKFLKNTYINGATRWVGNNPVIQLSDRWKSDDRIWFTLFHEIGHILKHGKKDQFLNMHKNLVNNKEKEADDFASEILFNSKHYRLFLDKYASDINREAIINFSKEYEVSPSIIVGRLEHDRIIKYSSFPDMHRRIEAIA